jgi:hypothetical protein
MRAQAEACLLILLGAASGCWRADKYAVTRIPATDGGVDSRSVADATKDHRVDAPKDSLPDGFKDSDSIPSLFVYVAPDGDDNNPGSLAQPVRTVARARDLVRTLNGAMTEDISVILRGGTYPQSSTLVFTSADSGNNGYYVRYMAYPGERPLLTGGQAIKGWKLFDAGSNIYTANAGSTAFRQLYVNGSKAVRARSPNLGANGAANFFRLTGFDSTAHNVQVASGQVASFANLNKVEMHLMTAWADNTLRIASITIAGSTASIKFQSTEDAILFVRPNPRLDQMNTGPERAFYFENALEMLDQPGEWYLDETTSTLYYKPRTGEDMATALVVAPMVETILRVKGPSTSDPASYLWFQGLSFAHSTYMRPSQYGFLDDQAGQYNLTAQANNNQTVGRPAAGVSVSNAHHIHFERNLFTQMAATGLDLVSGTHDDLIIGNVFTDIGGSGISIGKFVADENTEYHIPYNPADKSEICTSDTISNNLIDNVTTEIQGACGIAAGYPARLTIEHNEVSRTNFTGISVGYGWTAAVNAMTNNKINRNNIHHVAGLLAGAAGISTQSNQGPDSEIQYNYLHDFGRSTWADYAAQGLSLDEGTDGYTVAHNLMLNTPGVLSAGSTGANVSLTDNGARPSGREDTLATAGIEPAYADIKGLSVPLPTF